MPDVHASPRHRAWSARGVQGSVSWKVAKALQARGHRTGLFVSPHLACFRERVQVDGCLIPEEAVERLLPPIIRGARDANIPATFFELVTQLAFCHYADEGVECVPCLPPCSPAPGAQPPILLHACCAACPPSLSVRASHTAKAP